MSPKRPFLAVLAALLVAASAACRNDAVTPKAVKQTIADSSDQVMFGARTLITNDGLLRAELFADTAVFFDDNTRIELRNVRTNFHTSSGAKNTVLTSKSGTYDTRRNFMEARGDVVVVSVDGRRLETPQLRYDQVRNEISGDSAFVMTEPGRRLEGIGFVSDPDMRNVRVLKAARGSTGVIELPGN